MRRVSRGMLGKPMIGRARARAASVRVAGRVCGAVVALSAAVSMVGTAPASAVKFRAASSKVALIPARGPVGRPDGQMPSSGIVSGVPADSFSRFTFTNVALSQINSATLAQYDTAVLMQVETSALSAAQKAAIVQFVTNGGKLIIHDADETSGNDYSWLPYPSRIGAGCTNCGSTSGTSKVVVNTTLISASPSDASYVDLAEMGYRTDATGDANLFVSSDPHWLLGATVTNGKNETGSAVTYANDNGLMIYNGYDTDFVRPSSASPWRCVQGWPAYECGAPASGVDWLAKMWYAELAQSWGTLAAGQPLPPGSVPELAGGAPAINVGTVIAPAQIGLPTARKCVARRTLSFTLAKLSHSNIRQVDVYINGKHVLRKRGLHLKIVTLRSLPKKGRYSVKIILTTKRGYHLISRRTYKAC
jgi:hypothetical protein